jgi:hypothetical protein
MAENSAKASATLLSAPNDGWAQRDLLSKIFLVSFLFFAISVMVYSPERFATSLEREMRLTGQLISSSKNNFAIKMAGSAYSLTIQSSGLEHFMYKHFRRKQPRTSDVMETPFSGLYDYMLNRGINITFIWLQILYRISVTLCWTVTFLPFAIALFADA